MRLVSCWRSLHAGRDAAARAGHGALRDALPDEPGHYPDTLDGAVEWIDADDAARGRALLQLVDFGNALPRRRRGDFVVPSNFFERFGVNADAELPLERKVIALMRAFVDSSLPYRVRWRARRSRTTRSRE